MYNIIFSKGTRRGEMIKRDRWGRKSPRKVDRWEFRSRKRVFPALIDGGDKCIISTHPPEICGCLLPAEQKYKNKTKPETKTPHRKARRCPLLGKYQYIYLYISRRDTASRKLNDEQKVGGWTVWNDNDVACHCLGDKAPRDWELLPGRGNGILAESGACQSMGCHRHRHCYSYWHCHNIIILIIIHHDSAQGDTVCQ